MTIITSLAPMLAPILGGVLMKYLSWPWIFVVQAMLGIISLVCVLFMEEPMARKDFYRTPWTRRFSGVLKNRRFVALILIFSMVGMPFFAFVMASSDIYITEIGVSEPVFGVLFGANAMCYMLGTVVCSRLSPLVGSMRLMTVSFPGIFLGGILMAFSPFPGFWRLSIPMALIAFFMALGRPPSTNIALEQVEGNTGTASSVLIFSYFIVGAMGMWIVSFNFNDKTRILGIMAVAVGGFSSVAWALLKPRLRLPVLDNFRNP